MNKNQRCIVAALSCAICVAVAGCESMSPANQAEQQKNQQVIAYGDANGAALKSGAMLGSKYWAGLYEIYMAAPVSQFDINAATGANNMINAYKAYEAHQISKDQLDAVERQQHLNFQQANSNYMAQQQAADQAAANQRRAMALQYYLGTRPVTTTCVGRSCTTY